MKKLLIVILCLLCLTGCKNEEDTSGSNKIYNKDFGIYEVPSDWKESVSSSSSNKYFYILKGEEQNSKPNNISINQGTNKYSEEDHETFKKAILAQLSFQASDKENIEINANGSTTDNGYILYTFIIKDPDEDIITTQYYIVGDYKYILIHETVFGESAETDRVAKIIVNSFKWQ